MHLQSSSCGRGLNVSLDFVLGNIEILGEQNSLFPSRPVYIHLSVISGHGNGPTQGKRKTLIHNKSFKCLDLIRFHYGGIELQTKDKCSINLNISVQKYSFKFKIFRYNREDCVPAQNLINRVFKKLRPQLQRKRQIKIELCIKLSLLRLFHVDHVVQNRRTELHLR